MRYFFYILIFLCAFFIRTGSLKSSESMPVKKASKVATFMDFATNLSHSSSPFSNKKAIGDWIEYDIGAIRLISADSGTKNLNRIWLALEVRLNPSVIMKNPLIKIKKNKNIQDINYFWPISLPLQPSEGLIYKRSATFPIEISLEKSNTALNIQLELDANFCSETCQKQKLYTHLEILAEENYYSPFSAFIGRALQFTPNIATSNQLQIGKLTENILWVKANLPQDIIAPSFLLLNSKTLLPINYTTQYIHTEKNQALIVLKTIEKLPNDMLLFMHADNQMWQINETIKEKKLPSLTSISPLTTLPLYLWLFFILISPSFVLFLKQNARNEISAKEINLKNMLGIVLGTLSGIIIYSVYSYSALTNSFLWLIFGIFLFTFLGVFSYPIPAFGYGILNTIIPYFTFFDKAGIPIPNNFLQLVHFFCCLSAVLSIPFIIAILKPQITLYLSKTLKNNNHYSLRFPMWLNTILFIYLALTLFFG